MRICLVKSIELFEDAGLPVCLLTGTLCADSMFALKLSITYCRKSLSNKLSA